MLYRISVTSAHQVNRYRSPVISELSVQEDVMHFALLACRPTLQALAHESILLKHLPRRLVFRIYDARYPGNIQLLKCFITHQPYSLSHDALRPVFSQKHVAYLTVAVIHIRPALNRNAPDCLTVKDYRPEQSVHTVMFTNHVKPPVSVSLSIRRRQPVREITSVHIVAEIHQFSSQVPAPIQQFHVHAMFMLSSQTKCSFVQH